MTNTIFYFTGTGNCLMVAKSIAAGLGDARAVPISRAVRGSVDTGGDIVGLVFPVYWGGLPLIVRKFLPLLEHSQESYLFAVATHAGGPGKVLSQLQAELKALGLELSAGYRLSMPSNYVISYDAPDEDDIKKDLEQADRIIADIIETVRERKMYRPSTDFPKYERPNSAYERFIAGVNSLDAHYEVEESCTGCGDCARVCPVANIVLRKGRPTWLHHCEQCLACINWCPVKAIQYGSGTSSRGRYTNPRVSIDDVARPHP